MEGSKKGIAKEKPMSYLERTEAEYAKYLRAKYFSGKDIYGDDIFEEVNVGGEIIRTSRISPTRSYADPVAYQKEVAELKKKSVADTMKAEESRRPPLPVHPMSTGKQVASPNMQDSSNERSDALHEISVRAWSEFQSAMKQAKSGAGPSENHH